MQKTIEWLKMSTLVCCEMVGSRPREGLKLSLNRSLSEPGTPSYTVPPSAIARSPTSINKNYQYRFLRSEQGGPMKRCKLESTSLPSSPCTESTTLQRALITKKVTCIEADELKERIEQRLSSGSNLFLLDCRSFIAYNVNHIRGAFNVNCTDRINRRRLQMGKASLADLATSREGKEMLKRRSVREVIVYDDTTDSMDRITTSHPLYIVLSALVEDNKVPVLLLGKSSPTFFMHKNTSRRVLD